MLKDFIQPKEWLLYNRQGLFPGPGETEAEFNARVLFCSRLKEELFLQAAVDFPFTVDQIDHQNTLETALRITEQLYDIRPTWVPVFFSNYQLAPWHGGCAWIFQFSPTTPTAAFL